MTKTRGFPDDFVGGVIDIDYPERHLSRGGDSSISQYLDSLSGMTDVLQDHFAAIATDHAKHRARTSEVIDCYKMRQSAYMLEICELRRRLQRVGKKSRYLKKETPTSKAIADAALSQLDLSSSTQEGLMHLANKTIKRHHNQVCELRVNQVNQARVFTAFKEDKTKLEQKLRLSRYVEQELRDDTDHLGEALAEKTEEQLAVELELMNELSKVKQLYNDLRISSLCRELILEVAIDALGCAFSRKAN